MRNHAVKSKSESAAMLTICFLLPLLTGGVILYFSGAFRKNIALTYSPLNISAVAAATGWVAAFISSGLTLYLLLSTNAHTHIRHLIRRKAVGLWLALFTMTLILPFFVYQAKVYLFSFIWLSIICALSAALLVFALRLRFISAVIFIPYAAFSVIMTYVVFFAAINYM